MGIFATIFGKTATKKMPDPEPVKPDPGILEVVREYLETDNSMDKFERNHRCNELILELEWNLSHRERPESHPNFCVLWAAVCEHNIYYDGDKHEHDMVYNICERIMEKYTS